MSAQKIMSSDTIQSGIEGAGIGATPSPDVSAEPQPGVIADDAMGLLARHGGKLAVGAAAMLGLAAFYHWRESKLAKDDEAEFQRLQRIKAALDVNEPKPKGKR